MTQKIQFKMDGVLKLEKVGDYFNLVGKTVKLVFKKQDSSLKTQSFLKADVAALSETGTHLVLKSVKKIFELDIKKYSLFL